MLTTPPEKLDMYSWVCETAACALGTAALHPPFMAMGLRLEKFSGRDVLTPTYNNLQGCDAGMAFFNLSESQAFFLFLPSSYLYDENGRYRDIGPITPLNVVEHIDILLNRGHHAQSPHT
jgi:hypothetical protein